jgi:hypothetical protein
MLKEKDPVTDEDRIVAYLMNEGEVLSPELEYKRKVYEYVLTNMLEHRQDRQIVKLLQMQFQLKKTSAYKAIEKCKEIHGRVFQMTKNFELYRHLQDIEHAIRWAKEQNDIQNYLKALDLKDKLLQRVPEQQDIPWDKLGQKNYFMLIQVGDKEMLKLNTSHLEKMPVEEREKVLKAITQPAIDAQFEILENEVRKSAGK